mmetsp:Transcript_26376/g.38970  ORF Transcript_26376/g.38970 Transcript_26376/m.38970 type:complete len:633 (-) Transcript_26376:57-1955(-)
MFVHAQTFFFFWVGFFPSGVASLNFLSSQGENVLNGRRIPPKARATFGLAVTSNATSLETPQTEAVGIIPNGESFRDTVTGELSVVSYNVLAPSYNCLGYGDEMDAKVEIDRQTRLPMSIELGKSANADILCLQEVEGGSQELGLKNSLEEASGRIPGYDSYLWTSLNPNRKGDIVGLCIAWRSCKHNMMSAECFRRGMVIQFEEIESGATFCIGNVHLPAKASAIEGRLKALSTAIKKTESCEPIKKVSPLDGFVLIAGDFNCDQNSVSAELLKTGSTPYGTIRDRNYKAKISKNTAFRMRHKYIFTDIYDENIRELAAPITVSLTGRGPGCMDQMFFALHDRYQTNSKSMTSTDIKMGKRKSRRIKAKLRIEAANQEHVLPIVVDSVLATVQPDQKDRLETIIGGLPNIEKGFPSDHIPIGALFAPDETFQIANYSTINEVSDKDNYYWNNGVSASTRKRRESYMKSLLIRRRHNAILQAVAEWLIARGAKDIIRDQPLYRWKWLEDVKKVKGKLRAPDLCCVIEDSLIIVEITVGGKPEQMRREKIKKYKDLQGILSNVSIVKETNLSVLETFVILIDGNGELPDATFGDLNKLAKLSSSSVKGSPEIDAKLFRNRLKHVFTEANADNS